MQFSAFSNDKSLVNNLYYIEENATIFDPPVPNHTVVKDYHYPTSPVSVWYMIDQYSTLDTIPPPGGWRKYGERVATTNSTKEHGVLSFYVYKTPAKIYKKYLDEAYSKYDVTKYPKNEPKANDEARKNLVDYLKNDWDGGITGGKKGLINIKAQTRIAASYGLLQLTYPVAISSSVNYPSDKDNSPEKLLETDNTKWSIKHLTNLLKDAIKSEKNKDANWSLGLENTFKSKIWYPKWNKLKTYGNEVLNFVKVYTPNK
jgi:hypothetical protein